MKKIVTCALIILLFSSLSFAGIGDLLISEIKVVPDADEFIEIYNNGSSQIVLTDVYITDATFRNGSVFYYNIVLGNGGGGAFRDFNAKFPDGATINPGEYQTIAIRGSDKFFTAYGIQPTYELYEDAASPDVIADMLPATANSIDTVNSGFTQGSNDGEVAILYTWDGSSDFVQDLDYILWGSDGEAVDKAGITVNTYTYAADTPIASQALISIPSHGNSTSWQRIDFNEGNETTSGGNGVTGADETSEDLGNTFAEAPPTPNGIAIPPSIVINEVDAVGTAEFIEIYGTPGSSLNDVTLVLYQGSDDTNYKLLDLSGNNIPANGYFLISDAAGLTPDLALNATLNDGAAAVAIYFSNISNFTAGGSVTSTDIIDALVYDSGQASDAGLLALLNAGQLQINENANSNAATESNARCPNGSGGALNTNTYNQVTPTAGTINNMCPIGDYYATVDTTDATTLRTTLHNIIKNAISYPYSGGATDTWEILSFADEDHNTSVDASPNTAEGVWMIYKNNSYPYNGGGTQSYNREHTWPKSYGFSNPANNAPRTDAHHLMMSDAGYNSDRGNKYYDNCNASCTERVTSAYNGEGTSGSVVGGGSGTYPGNSNWFDANSFEVWNFRKGDIARAMFYMDVRYEGDQTDTTGTPEPDLILTDNASLIQTTASSPAYMGLLSVLLQWHNADPVDNIEMHRNEEIYGYQQNRNPFIDHPEWVACIFQSNCVFDAVFSNGFE